MKIYGTSFLIEDIQPIHCQQVINNQSGNSKTHISEVINALNFIFEHAIDDGIISANPTAKITKPKGTRTHKRALTAHEREHFIKVGITDRRFYCLCFIVDAALPRQRNVKVMTSVLTTDTLYSIYEAPKRLMQMISSYP